MLDSENQAFFDAIVVLLFKIVTFPLNLVKFGQKMKEQHQFFKIQDGGNHHVGF